MKHYKIINLSIFIVTLMLCCVQFKFVVAEEGNDIPAVTPIYYDWGGIGYYDSVSEWEMIPNQDGESFELIHPTEEKKTVDCSFQ